MQGNLPVLTRSGLRLEFPLQNFTREGGIRLALAQLHHLAFEKIERGGFAGFEIHCRTTNWHQYVSTKLQQPQ